MTNDLSPVEYVVIVGYLAALVGMGLAVRRFSSDASDYFRNGCKGTWWLVGASAFMQIFSAWTFTGAAGAAYEAGWSVMIIFGANTLCFFLVFLFLGPWFRQLRAITAPEIIRLRFGPATQQFYAWAQGVLGLLYAAVWLWGLSVFVAAVFDFEQLALSLGFDSEVNFVIVLTGTIVLIYSVAGGSWAVMATDFLQGLVLVPLTLLVAILCLREIGGVGEMFQTIDDQGLSDEFRLINDQSRFDLGKYGPLWAIAVVLYKTVGFTTLTTAQKYFGVKDGRDARKAGLFACSLMLLGMLFWFVPPVVARLTIPGAVEAMEMSKPAESSYALIATRVLPVGLTGLMVVAMLSATMSSMDSGLNRNAAVFVRDIEPLFRRLGGFRPATDREQYYIGQVVSVFLGLAIIGLALYFAGADGKGVFEWMLNIGSMVALPMAVPTFLALFVRTAPSWSAIAAVCVTLVPSALAFFSKTEGVREWAADTPLAFALASEWPYYQTVFINTSIGCVVFFGSTLFWRRASEVHRRRVSEFFLRMHTPVDFAREVGPGNDAAQLGVVGSFAVVLGSLISLLAVNPVHDWVDRAGILFVGGCVAGAGVLFLLGRRKLRARERALAARQAETQTTDPDGAPRP